MILYNRKKVKYRKDGYCWKKRKDGKTTREDHMKLKVQGVEVKGRKALAVHKCCFWAARTQNRFGVTCCQHFRLPRPRLLFCFVCCFLTQESPIRLSVKARFS